MLLKPFQKHIKSFIGNSLDFLIKCPRDVDEDTELAMFGVITLYTSIPHKFGLEAVDYFWLHIRRAYIQDLKKELVLK